MTRDAHRAVGEVWCDEGEHWAPREFCYYLGRDDTDNEVWICANCEDRRVSAEEGYQ